MKIKRIDSGDPLKAKDSASNQKLAALVFAAATQKWPGAKTVELADISGKDPAVLDSCANIRTVFKAAADPGYRLFYEYHATPQQGWALLKYDHQEVDVRWWQRDGATVYQVKIRGAHEETLAALSEEVRKSLKISYYK